MILEELIVPLLMDRSDFLKGIEESQSKASGLTMGLSAIGGTAVMGAIGAATAGIGALTGFLGVSTLAAMDAEDIQADLLATLKSTGGVAGMTADSINDLATELSEVTKFEDDAIVSGEAMLLTFTNIGENVFPQATEMMLNLSQKMGTDLKSSAVQLGKALNDPTKGMTALTRVGVAFTKEQAEMIKTLQEAGDIEGAQTIILNELEKEFGGLARAAGETLSGKLEILKNKFGNIQETVGGAIIPVITQLADTFSDWLSDPAVQTNITAITDGIVSFATDVIDYIPKVISTFQNVVAWFQANPGVIIAGLAAIGVAVGVFVWTTAIPALVAFATTTLVTFGPAILLMSLVGGAVYLLYKAWENNFGGMRDYLIQVWDSKLKPVFQQVKAWLEVNIPIAIQTLKKWWDNTAIPALQRVWDFIKTKIFPIFTTLVAWLSENIPVAVQKVSDFWNNTLKPALEAVWGFIQDPLMPLFAALVEFFNVAFTLALTAMAGLWQNVLQPALKAVGDYVSTNLQPVLKSLSDFWKNTLGPALSGVKTDILDALPGVFRSIRDAVGWVIDKVKAFTEALKKVKLPKWLEPGSPPPLYWALLDVRNAFNELNSGSLPEFSTRLNVKDGMPVESSKNNDELIKSLVNNKNKPLNERKLARIMAQEIAKAIG